MQLKIHIKKFNSLVLTIFKMKKNNNGYIMLSIITNEIIKYKIQIGINIYLKLLKGHLKLLNN